MLKACAICEAGKKYAAANTFLKVLDQDPLHLDARCRLGMIYTEWAHYRGALEQFDFVLQQDPQNSCARQNRTIAARDMLAIFTPLVVDDYFHYARTYVGMRGVGVGARRLPQGAGDRSDAQRCPL